MLIMNVLCTSFRNINGITVMGFFVVTGELQISEGSKQLFEILVTI